MASGIDVRVGAIKETVYGTRVAPTRFFEANSWGLTFDRNFYISQGLGGGFWRRKRVETTRGGGGGFSMEVPTNGFQFWLDLMHGATPTVAQQASTIAYLHTHPFTAPPNKSASMQIQVPPTQSSTLLPFDYSGIMLTGGAFSWEPAGVLMFEPTLDIREQVTNLANATVTLPTGAGLFSFKGGALTIGGVAVADIVGGGNVAINWPMRTDAYPLGSSGLKMQPLPDQLPEFTGSLTADFVGMTHYNRVVAGTIADVVLTFTGALIVGAHNEEITITLPDAAFTGPPPTVDGPGPVGETITFMNASSTGDAPTITYKSIDTAT